MKCRKKKSNMKKLKLSETGARGWFVGDFDGAVVRTKDFEVNWTTMPRSQAPSHYHLGVTEIQLITRGRMLMNGVIFEVGDICVLESGEIAQTEYLEETDAVAIKFPSIPDNKHYL